MELYIVRHGETVWNREKRLQGNVDIELNESGRELAGRTGEALEHVAFDRIYSSPLSRAYETACLIRGHRNIPVVRDERLRELSFGVREGHCKDELDADENDTFRYFFTRPERYRPVENGESLEHICGRAGEFLREVVEPLAREKKTERIMIVSHGALNKALMCHIANHGIADYWAGGLQKNCGVIIVRLDENGYHVLEENAVFYT